MIGDLWIIFTVRHACDCAALRFMTATNLAQEAWSSPRIIYSPFMCQRCQSRYEALSNALARKRKVEAKLTVEKGVVVVRE